MRQTYRDGQPWLMRIVMVLGVLCLTAHAVVASAQGFAYGEAFYWSSTRGLVGLGVPQGYAYSYATALNNNGQIVGVTGTGTSTRAFLWTETGGFTILPTLGGQDGEVRNINDAGQVVGASTTLSGALHAFIWTQSGGIQDITPTGSFMRASGINSQGQVVGGGDFAFLSTQQSLTVLGGGEAFGINASGAIVGCNGVAGQSYPIIWRNGIQWLPSLPDCDPRGAAFAINDSGQAVGVTDWWGTQARAFLWTPQGGMIELGDFGGTTTFALAINSNGEIVGWGEAADGMRHPFLWTSQSGMVDFLGLPAMASDINDLGEIVGGLSVRVPVSATEPTTMLLLGCGLGLFVLAGIRRNFRSEEPEKLFMPSKACQLVPERAQAERVLDVLP